MSLPPQDPASQKLGRVVVGALAGAFGVRGEIRIKSFCTEPADIADYAPLYTEDGREFTQITLTGQTSGALVARLEGVKTKEDADALKGVSLLADKARLPALPDDEYYYNDLIGLPVYDAGGTALGHVQGVMNHGAGDLLELRRASGETVLMTFTMAHVPTVDIAAGRIIIDPPEGLF